MLLIVLIGKLAVFLIRLALLVIGSWLVISAKLPEALNQQLFGKREHELEPNHARLYGLLLASPMLISVFVSIALDPLLDGRSRSIAVTFEHIYLLAVVVFVYVTKRRSRPQAEQQPPEPMASDEQPGCTYLIKWIVTNALALIIGVISGGVFLFGTRFLAIDAASRVLIGAIITGFPMGIVVGVMQSMLLKPWLTRKAWWTIATILGWPFAMIWLFDLPEGFDAVFLGCLVLLFVPGILHWLVLRAQIQHAGWWMLGSFIGLLSSVSIAGYLERYLNTLYADHLLAPGRAIPTILFPIPYSVITGIVLIWMMSGNRGITRLVMFPKEIVSDDGQKSSTLIPMLYFIPGVLIAIGLGLHFVSEGASYLALTCGVLAGMIGGMIGLYVAIVQRKGAPFWPVIVSVLLALASVYLVIAFEAFYWMGF